MAFRKELIEAQASLRGKITERRKALDTLIALLKNEEVIACIDEDDHITWKSLLESIQCCLRTACDRISGLVAKKGPLKSPDKNIELSIELLTLVAKTALPKAEINISSFISYIEACLRDRTMRCCKDTFLRMIKDYILPSRDCLGALEPEDFVLLFEILRTELNQSSSESKNLIIFSSFALLVKLGPLAAFPANFLRDQFAFFAKLGQSVTLNDPRILQEDAIDIILHFCQHTAEDNRLSCIKLGEEVLPKFANLYDSCRPDALKVKLIEFFLLQLVLHHPNGALENDSQALANKWTTWKSCIIKIYHLLLAEIHQYLRQPVKNTQFFTCTEDNTVIKDSFALLFVETCNQLFTYTELPAYLCEDFQPEKRKRIEVSLETFIGKIQDTNSWVWVKLVGALLQKYPQLIDRLRFLNLLQVLHTKQLKVRDNNTIRCIYEMQAVLLDIEERLDVSDQNEIFNLWTLVGDSTLRAVGLNHHIKETQHLLRKLICRQVIKVESVIQTYTSGVLITTEHHLATLQLVLEFTNPSQLPLSRKEELVNSLLNVPNIKNFRCLLKRNFAEVLVGLTLKHCPDFEREEESENVGSTYVYGTLAALFAKSTFNLEQIVIRAPALKAPTKRSFNTDSAALEILLKKLNAFVDSVYSESTDKLLCAVGLLYNIASCMVDYQVLQEDQLQSSIVFSLIERVLNNENTQSFERFQLHSGSALKELQAIAVILDEVFSINNSVTQRVKELFSFNFLKEILQVLQFFQDDSTKKADTAHKVKKLLVGALSKYCLVSNSVETAEHQPHIAEILADQDYDFKNDNHCEMSVVFMQNVKLAPPGVLSEEILRKILECLHGLCQATYRFNESAVTILNILAGLFQHLQHASGDLKSTAVNVLYMFYLRQSYYGPDVLIALLDAIEELCTMDVDGCYSQWDGKPAIKHVPDFLSSNFQRVRYRAVALLVNYLKISAGTTRLSTIHLSEELFSLIYEQNSKVFEVTDSLSQDRLQEEIACRASSALYTFLAIIVNCNNWIEESVLAIIRLEHSKGLGRLFNGELIAKVLKTLQEHFGSDDFVKTYVDRILSNWLDLGYKIDDFQFRMLGYSDKAELYAKHLDVCLPLLLQKDQHDLLAAAKLLGMTETDALERCCTKIFGRVIASHPRNLAGNFLVSNAQLSYIAQALGGKFQKILVENIDQVVLSLIEGIADEQAIQQSLGETVFFTCKVISLEDFRLCLQFIETFLCDGKPLIKFLSENKLHKIQKITLELQCRIYNGTSIDQQLKNFHQYTVFIDLILEDLSKQCSFLMFFLRDSVHFLVNLLNNRIACLKLCKSVLRFMMTFLGRVLQECASDFKKFFVFTANSLKNIGMENDHLSPICVEILEYLIIANEAHFLDVVSKLDAFPLNAKFKNLQQKQCVDRTVSLEDEIRAFLDYNDLTIRQDSLVHLKKLLGKEKEQLRHLYDELSKVRGFSEDCEQSLLHRLTTMLIKISCQHSEISSEALKCLGELGPANLTTIVLEPEKRVLNIKCTPFELLTGHVVSMLAQSVIDPDIKVVRAASEALHEVLGFKESEQVVEDFGYGPIEASFIMPFFNRVKSGVSQVRMAEDKVGDFVNHELTWCATGLSENQWVTSLVLALLSSFDQGCYLRKLIDLCSVKAKFCENLLPLLIYLILYLDNNFVTGVLSKRINEFFHQHWICTVSTPTKKDVIVVNKKAVKCLLDVINFIRQQPSLSSKFEELKLDYLKIAKAAAFCSAHFSALLYAELWCREKMAHMNELTFLDQILESVSEEERITFQQIMQNSYKSIGDLDALSGCGVSLLLRAEHQVEYYQNTGQWARATDYYIMHSIHDPNLNIDNLLTSFKMNHLYQMPLLCESLCREPDYECLWRLGQWKMSKIDHMKLQKIAYRDYEKYKFNCLKAVCDNDEYTFSTAKQQMSKCIVDKLKHTSLESSKSLYPILSQLQSLIEVEDCFQLFEGTNVENILAKWRLQDLIIRKNDFQFVEPIAAQRITLLRELSRQQPLLRTVYCEMVLNFVDYAKEECHIKVAENALIDIQKIPDLDRSIENELQLRIVQLRWLNGDKMIAHQLLRSISLSAEITPRLKAKSLMLQGIYMAETYSDRAPILNRFESSLQIYEQMPLEDRTKEDLENLEDNYDIFATFADREYQQIMAHIKSDLFQKKLSNIKSCKEMANALQRQKQKTDDERKAVVINEKQISIDENEIKAAFRDKQLVLQIALKHYINNLVASDKNNIKIFRVMALFIENKENKNVIDTLQKMIPKMSSYKYIPMLPQLIPHISNNQNDFFGQQINRIIEQCSTDHPHHTLPLLLALVNANKDREFTKSKKLSVNDRSATAVTIIKKLQKTHLRNIVDRMLKLSNALIELAYYVPEHVAARKNQFEIPSRYKIHGIRRFEDVLVPTCSIPPSRTNTYDTIEGIYKFVPKYKTVGGINAPKRIECLGTSGKTYLQLVKGQDDLRQDAVMQQVFRIMTDLLASNKQTKSLHIRTYKVVPLSMRSGILEWVANSMPIGAYLSGSSELGLIGAHREFRPKDHSPSRCLSLFKDCHRKSNDVKLSTYLEICKVIQPVFHKFFETHFRQPSVWYERRRAYIHSVATTSMCGYVLGLGDRHVSNILIDKQTAEVIHIDFGIAFEQGKCLPTPEQVPFRLTRDIVDGMGVSGIEGLFRKSCEKTMEVLRSNAQIILTILEVLLYDPLYFWTVSAAEATKRQTEASHETYKSIADEPEEENKNVSAERTLLRLQGKLQGTEQGKPTSIEQQVGALIQQAMDPANLCRLYFGWQPYL